MKKTLIKGHTQITEASIGRVVGLMYENAGILTNNYGRSGMTITENGAPVTITEATGETTSGKHGASISVDQWHKKSWWIGTAKFLEASWDLADGRLPHLKTDDSKAFNQTQTPKVE